MQLKIFKNLLFLLFTLTLKKRGHIQPSPFRDKGKNHPIARKAMYKLVKLFIDNLSICPYVYPKKIYFNTECKEICAGV